MSIRIKEPTIRKVRNRGFVPVRYHVEDNSKSVAYVPELGGGYYHGWVVSRGTKHIKFYVIALRRAITVPLAEERYMKEIAS